MAATDFTPSGTPGVRGKAVCASTVRTDRMAGAAISAQAWVAPAADPTAKKFDIVEHLRAAHHLTGAVADFRAARISPTKIKKYGLQRAEGAPPEEE